MTYAVSSGYQTAYVQSHIAIHIHSQAATMHSKRYHLTIRVHLMERETVYSQQRVVTKCRKRFFYTLCLAFSPLNANFTFSFKILLMFFGVRDTWETSMSNGRTIGVRNRTPL